MLIWCFISGRALPRHGRGHRFKSCRTHHFSAWLFPVSQSCHNKEKKDMATIRKRNNKWQVQVRHLGHNQISKTFLRKQEAEQWARHCPCLPPTTRNVEGFNLFYFFSTSANNHRNHYQ